MSKTKKFLIIDTETIGDVKNPDAAYNIGGIVADKKGSKYCMFDFFVSDVVFKDTEKLTNCYYFDKLPQYQTMFQNKLLEFRTAKQIQEYINSLLIQYEITTIYGYNLNFDIRTLNNTAKRYLNETVFIDNRQPINYYCIQNLACQTILRRKSFIDFVLDKIPNGEGLTEKGNIKTSAEIVYRYITKDPHFIESHTALNDCEIELQILIQCLRQHKKHTKALCNGWQIVKKFREEVGR